MYIYISIYISVQMVIMYLRMGSDEGRGVYIIERGYN